MSSDNYRMLLGCHLTSIFFPDKCDVSDVAMTALPCSRRVVIYLLMATLSLFTVPALCWKVAVYATIGELAWQHLTHGQQQDYDRFAEALLAKLEPYISEKTERFHLLSPFARAAILFDEWQMWHLWTVFEKYSAPIPETLKPIKDTKVRSLRFANILWPEDGPSCGAKAASEKVKNGLPFRRFEKLQ